MTRPDVPLKNPAQAAVLAWLVPGLGHLYQGRIGKGVLYGTCILGLFVAGMVLGEGKVVYWRWTNPLRDPESFYFSYLCQFFVGLPALPALIQATLKQYGVDPILWGYLAEPNDEILNGIYPRLGKLVEVGRLYTMVAGLLNVLAIYDAYDGPALPDGPAVPADDAREAADVGAGA